MELDRLSDLPEGILILIIRRIETKYAVRTCVLSKQWARLWTLLPSLYIDADSFDSLDSFQYFLLGLFIHYDTSKLYSVRFVSSEEDLDHRLVGAIIDYAISNYAEQLWINCPNMQSFDIPSQLLTCKILRGLNLERVEIRLPIPFCSDSLVSLYLDGVFVDSDILLNCRNLETFSMVDCLVSDSMSEIVISAPKLVDLDIQYEGSDDSTKKTMISISAPRLESISFGIQCDSILNIFIDRCPTLESVFIHFDRTLSTENTEYVLHKRKHAMHLVNFLKDVSDVRSLVISSCTAELFSALPELVKNLPSPFHNLKHLEVLRGMKNKSIVIPPEVVTFFVGASSNGSEILKDLEKRGNIDNCYVTSNES